MNSLIGYHGTTQENANKILEEKHFKESTKDNEWLGRGVYFFTFRYWAEWWVRIKKFENVAILKVNLEYTDEQLLDLDNPEQLITLDKIMQNVVKQSTLVKDIDFKTLKNTEVWCFACNFIKQLYPNIGIIAYTFQRNQDWHSYIKLCSNQRQVCVSNPEIITKIQQDNGKMVELEIGGVSDIC